MRITSKGQITIPARLMERTGLLPNTEVVFEELDGAALIRPATSLRDLLGQRLRRARGAATAGRTTADIMHLTRGRED